MHFGFFFSFKVLELIVNIQPKDSGSGGGETRESVVYKQADEMLEKLPGNFVPHEVSKMSSLCNFCVFNGKSY